jgi:hypothetical protein
MANITVFSRVRSRVAPAILAALFLATLSPVPAAPVQWVVHLSTASADAREHRDIDVDSTGDAALTHVAASGESDVSHTQIDSAVLKELSEAVADSGRALRVPPSINLEIPDRHFDVPKCGRTLQIRFYNANVLERTTVDFGCATGFSAMPYAIALTTTIARAVVKNNPAFLPPGVDVSKSVVALEGVTDANRHVRIVWTPGGGDIRTYFPSGAYTEQWFSRGLAIVRGPSGDIHGIREEPEQLARALLTGQMGALTRLQLFPSSKGDGRIYDHWVDRGNWPASGTQVAESMTLTKDASGTLIEGEIDSTIFGKLSFDGEVAIGWTVRPGLMSAAYPYQGAFPQTFLGKRVASPVAIETAVSTKVAGRVATTLVDTAADGLLISPAFARAMNVTAAPDGFIELHDVEIAGAHVARTFARLAADDRYDVRAGLRLFPGSTIALRRDGSARLVTTPCPDGLRFIVISGKMLFGLGWRHELFDSGHAGEPVTGEMDVHDVVMHHDVPCSAQSRPVMLENKQIGVDGMCFDRNLSFYFNDHGQPLYVMVVGLHSLATDRVVIDMRTQNMCW